MEKITSNRLFLVFLLIYLVVLAEHAISDLSWGVLLGLSVALMAHAKKNKITLLLLISHMIIEWLEWGVGSVTLVATMINMFHAALDFTFLRHELKVHSPERTQLILGGVSVVLVAVFCIASQVNVPEEVIEGIHPIVLGGVIGCVLSHISFHIKKE